MQDGIIIVDDHAAFRLAIRQHLHQDSEFQVVAEFPDGRDFLEADLGGRCGIVLLDISMPRMNGIAVLKVLPDYHPQLRPVIVSGQHEDAYRQQAFEHKAAGFVPKDSVYSELIPCIRKVLAGERWFPEHA